MKLFYIMNDDKSGIVIREVTPFYNDRRNDKETIIAQIGLHASSIARVDRNRICTIDKIPQTVELLCGEYIRRTAT